MRYRTTRWLGLAVLVTAGCRLLSPVPSLVVTVLDAETSQPIPGAAVRIGATATPHPTEPDGTARLTAAADAGVVLVEAEATGYLAEVTDLDVHPTDGPLTATVRLFAGPSPSLALTLPAGYRGPVVVTLNARPDAPGPAGRRAFTAVVPDDGKVTVAGPAVLNKLTAYHISAAFADDTTLSKTDPEGVAFRWAKSGDTSYHFVVGTQAECDEYAKTLNLPSPPRGGGGKAGGGKGGGRRGGGGGRRGAMGVGP